MNKSEQFQKDPICGYDPWTQALAAEFQSDTLTKLQEMPLAGMTLEVRQGRDSLWLVARWPGHGGVAFRSAYAPGTGMKLTDTRQEDQAAIFSLTSSLGAYTVRVETPPFESALLHWTVTLTPSAPTLLPFWPSDVYPLDAKGNPTATRGTVHAGQAGLAGGFLFLTLTEPPSGSLLYLQDLTALNDLCEKTGTTPESRVGGLWPQLGYSPPPCDTQPLPAGEPTVISSAWARLSPEQPADERQAARLFLDGLAEIYPHLARPDTPYHDWPGLAKKTLRDLDKSPKCTVRELGHRYLHPYTDSEYPDSMVQLTVLLPILEYSEWQGKHIPLADELRAGVPGFYDKKLATLRRYLPTVGEDKNADAVDSWYLYHPLANLGRLAKQGDGAAQDLFFNALDFGIKIARHFRYQWPVQFNVRTLEVLTGERKPGEPGQTDVGGLYAYVMLQAYDLSQDKRYLREAEKAVRALSGYHFSIAYQMNLTAWGANACLRLFQITGDAFFREQSEVLLASYFHHTMLWQSRLGHAKHYPIFLGALCLHDSPYMAIYECYESLAGFHEYLALAGDDILPSLRLLLTEYIKYTLDRAWFYYPAHLPKEALATDIRNGHIDRALAIPLEDLYADGQPAGQVGQEVYGSGAAFALTTRAYHRLPDAPFLIYSEYPLTDIAQAPDQCVGFTLRGDPRFVSRLRLIPTGRKPLPPVHLSAQTPQAESPLDGAATPEGHREYLLPGGSQVEVRWR